MNFIDLRYALPLLLLMAPSAFAQTWTSGSNGSDKALLINASTKGVNAGVYDFDPVALNLDLDGDNVYQFTTITISDNITVRLRPNKLRTTGPVVWLATGAVSIQGYIDLNGSQGHPSSSNLSIRTPSLPGPGGYPGGVGAKVNDVPQPGSGPGGGNVSTGAQGCPAAYAVPGYVTGQFTYCSSPSQPLPYGTAGLQPLIGGSGGSGAGAPDAINFGAGGGAGGGAFRLSSTISITFPQLTTGYCGSIQAYGGNGGLLLAAYNYGGAGSGGAIHLQAPVINGCGTYLYVTGGVECDPRGCGNYGSTTFGSSEGRVRIDANSISGVTASPDPAITGPLVTVPLPANPTIQITTVGGQTVPANPVGSSASPDLTINSTSAVTINVAASNIPVGTAVTLIVSTDQPGADITSTVNLTGTTASSTATTSVTLPQGTSILFVTAVW